MKKHDIISRLEAALDELTKMILSHNKNEKDGGDFMDLQTAAEGQEALEALNKLYDDQTEYKDTEGTVICIGDNIDLLASNMYNGTVNLLNGVVCLETTFFNKPLTDHLHAEDLQYAIVEKPSVATEISGDDLPF